MKQVKVIVPPDKLKIVNDLMNELNLVPDFFLFENTASISLIVDNNKTAIIIEELKGIGVGHIFGSINISPVDIEINAVKKKESLSGKKSLSRAKGRGISLDEMISNLGGLGVISPTFMLLAMLASALAGFGLRFDSIVIVIASMIIAPFLGPIALGVIGTMLPENKYRNRPVITEAIGLLTCVLVGMLIGVLLPLPGGTPEGIYPAQILDRTAPGLGDVIFAILSGLAAGIFIVRGESTSIVGVAVAASLCPPATNIGLLLSAMKFGLAFGSLLLLVLNVISIYAACAIIFWISQSIVRGGTISSRQFKKISKRYYAQIIIAFIVLAGVVTSIMFLNPPA